MAFRYRPPDNGDDGGLGPPPGPFRFRPRRRFRLPGGLFRWAIVAGVLILLFIILNVVQGIYADWLWFSSVDHLQVYRLRIVTRIWLFFAGAGLFLVFFGGNVLGALRLSGRAEPGEGPRRFSLPGEDTPEFQMPEIDPSAARRVITVVALALTLFVAVIFGTQAAGQWDNILLFINSEPFGIEDPAFNRDVGFYVFELPALNFINGWALAMVVFTTIVVAAVYAFGVFLSGFSSAASRYARPHVSALVVIAILLYIWRYWLGRYALVYSERGAAFGASYTDINAQLPVTYVLMGIGALTAACVVVSVFQRRWLFLPIASTALWVVAAIVGGLIYPATVQRFNVEPNELSRERQYIERNIEATRFAYGLDRIEELDPEDAPNNNFVTFEEIADNPETIRSVRLWDTRPLLQTLNQIQTIRPLYDFVDVDLDRYIIDDELRQVALAPRELNPGKLPEDAQSWVNKRLQFTHGFGITVVPVNEVVEEGLPEFFIRDIPASGVLELEGAEDEYVIEQPRLYFGEMPDHYVIVNSTEEEFDYPLGDDRATNVYTEDSGVQLNSFWRRLTYAWEFGDTNILISDAINSDSRILYRRNIHERVEAIAPFLEFDGDPYITIADGRLFWIQDAYTTTDRYPYSTRLGDLNYIRNSVKVVVDAFDGSVTFYLVEPDDPIVRVYDKIYPDLFTPFEEMPETLREHIRYPEDLFRVQAQQYLSYHIQDPAVFFNREDVWDIPTEVFVAQEQPIEPYYVVMRLPTEQEEEFVLILPFRPANRNNTIAWLAARSDGENYGRLLTFRFPTETTFFGPSQVESRIDADDVIAQQFSLWNQSGSQVIRGNLLMIPIGKGNLYVEPVYLQATASSLPELKRVIVANGQSIAMEPTLERALEVVLGLAEPSEPTIEDVPEPTPGEATPEEETPEEPTPTAAPPTEAPETPGPTTELPDDVAELIRLANESFERAQEFLQDGDFAGYGEEIERLEQILQQLADLTEIGGQ